MKRILFAITLMLGLTAVAQERNMVIYKGETATHIIPIANIDSVKIEVTEIGNNTINGYEWVDLGLNVKWATHNIGATTPEEYGSYFSWGESEAKEDFTPKASTTMEDVAEYSGDATYDAATANWKGSWRTPTKTEIEELISNCTWEYLRQNEVSGFKITGPNGNSVFLPAAGYSGGTTVDAKGVSGCYWCSTPADNDSYHLNGYYFQLNQSAGPKTASGLRKWGLTIRPVSD